LRSFDSWRWSRFRLWLGYGGAFVAVFFVSLLIGFAAGWTNIANVSMLYLIAVLVIATAFGSGPAVLASVLAFLTFDWFFVDPLHSFTIDNPEEWVALLMFLLAAIITGQLAAGQRRRAQQAREREQEAVVLYDVVRLLSKSDLREALSAVAERLRQELGLAAVAIYLTDGPETTLRAGAGELSALPAPDVLGRSPSSMLGEGIAPTGSHRGVPGRWVRIVSPYATKGKSREGDRVHIVQVKSQGRKIGTLCLSRGPRGLQFNEADNRLLSAVSSQLGIAVERTRLREEAMKTEVLQRADEVKTNLLNAVSHDLRTPLASIMASAGSLLQKDVDWSEGERDQFAAAIERETLRLNRIVNNLLDLSRIQGGGLRPEFDWYPLGPLIGDVLQRLRPSTARHHVVVDLADGLPPVRLDYVQIDQVLSNLVENAAKYSPPATEIRIRAQKVDEEIRIAVEDRGPGIPAEATTLLFRPFERLQQGGARPKGTGLGLAVAKGLVEAHGGRIWVENRREGGSRFVFTLPITRHDPHDSGSQGV